MELTLYDLLRTSPFDESYLLTKNHNIREQINSITVMDIPDIDLWSKPHELIIIGIFFEKHIPTIEFLDSLKEKKCAGIITKERFLRYIPTEFIEHADKISLPLIVVPNKYSWSELMNPVNETIIRHQNNKISEAENFQLFLIKVLLENSSYDKIASQISKIFKYPLALIGPNKEIIDSSPDYDWQILEILNDKDAQYHVISTHDNAHSLHGYNWIVEDSSIWYFAMDASIIFFDGILVALPKEIKHISQTLRLQLLLLIQILQLKSQLYRDVYQDNSRFKELILNELLTKKSISDSEKIKYEIALGHIFESHYYLCCVHITDTKRLNKYYEDQNTKRIDNYLYEKVPFKDKMIVFDYQRNQFLIFIGASVKNIQQSVQTLYTLLNKFFDTSALYLGISQKHSLNECGVALKEAKEAANISIQMGTRKHYHFYSNLGFLRLLTNKNGDLDTIYYNELLDTFVNPLIKYDETHKSELLNTILKYIELNFSILTTSEELYIHINTLRARLKRIEEILKIDLNNSDHLLNLQIALKIYEATIRIDE